MIFFSVIKLFGTLLCFNREKYDPFIEYALIYKSKENMPKKIKKGYCPIKSIQAENIRLSFVKFIEAIQPQTKICVRL